MLTVVRHGRTDANRSGLLLGRLDVDLDPVGAAQAKALAAAVGPVDRVVASPLRRTRATAEAFGTEVEIDDRWIELDYGELDGTPTRDVPDEVWAAWLVDLDFAPQGGESLRSVGERVAEACDDLQDSARSKHIVVVTHVSPIKAALAWALGVSGNVAWRSFVAPASITQIAIGRRGPLLHGFNNVSHLDHIDGTGGG